MAHGHELDPALAIQGAAQRLAKIVEDTSGGRFRIEVFAGGQIMGPFACFDAASQGTIEAFMACSYYWTEQEPAAEWFTTVPFGMNPEGMDRLVHGRRWPQAVGGDVRAIQPRAARRALDRAADGGWFRKRINAHRDYKGLKMRIPSLGGKVVARAGGTSVLTPGS